MMPNADVEFAVVIPVGPGAESILDTLHSIEVFCPETQAVVLVDDATADGTYEALIAARQPHWTIHRNERSQGTERLVHTLCSAFKHVLAKTTSPLVLRLDQDALVIKPGLVAAAIEYARAHPQVGMFGVYEVDYNRARNYEFHGRLIAEELAWWRRLLGRRPSWSRYLTMAERHGYRRGDNVFGGAYFLTRACLEAIARLGALDVPWQWHSQMQEDVYFSLVTMAAGFRLGHFAAPDGPLCLEWRGLPYPAATLASSPFKLVHSVDKGQNTGPSDNGGRTAREIFRDIRMKYVATSDA